MNTTRYLPSLAVCSSAMSFTIDVHHHILPDFFFRETNDAHNPVGGIAPPPWNTDLMLSFMDEAGIDVAD